MENLLITKTNKTPEINFNKNGKLLIWGKIFNPLEPVVFMDTLYDWVEKYSHNPAPVTEINFRIGFTFTECWRRYMGIVQKLAAIQDRQHSVKIIWYFEDNESEFKQWLEFELKQMNVEFVLFPVDNIE